MAGLRLTKPVPPLRTMIEGVVALQRGVGDALYQTGAANRYEYVDENGTLWLLAATVRTSATDNPAIGITTELVEKLRVEHGEDHRIGLLYFWIWDAQVNLVIMDPDAMQAQPSQCVRLAGKKFYVDRDEFSGIAEHPGCVLASQLVRTT